MENNQMKFKSQTKQVISDVAGDANLVDALLAYNVAVENLYAAEACTAEAETVMDNIASACESIKKFGCVPANMAIFDHNGDLSAALGFEALSIASLESKSVSELDSLKGQYVAGLEGLARDAWNAFIAGVEKLWKAIVDWFKRILDKNEKYKQYIETNQGALNGAELKDQKVTALTYAQAKQCGDAFKAISAILANVQSTMPAAIGAAEKGELGNVGEALFKSIDSQFKTLEALGIKRTDAGVEVGEFPFKEEEKTFAELGYDAGKAQALCKIALGALNDQNLKKLAHAIDKAYAEAIKSAKAAGDDAKKQEIAKNKKAVAAQADKMVKFGNTCLTKLAYSAYVCVKAAKAPAKPAEGEGEGEKK